MQMGMWWALCRRKKWRCWYPYVCGGKRRERKKDTVVVDTDTEQEKGKKTKIKRKYKQKWRMQKMQTRWHDKMLF